MSVKKKILRSGLSILGTLGSGIGEPLLTQNQTTHTIDKVNAVDITVFLSNTLQDGRILIGNVSNVATPQQVSGMLTLSDTGIANIVANTITDSHINTGAAISYSKLNLTGLVVNNDIANAAGIARTKIANGTAYRILINNSSGVFSEASAITGSRLLVSDVNGIPTFSNVTSAEAAFLSGTTSSIQTQLNNRLFFNSGITPATGDLVYFSGGTWNNLPRGTSGQYLVSTVSTLQWITPPNGVPTGGTANQYLTKIDSTDFNTQWSTLNLAKISDVTATAAQVNVLATGFYDATTSVQGQLDSKFAKTLNQNYLVVGNASNIAVGLPSGTNGYILTSVSGVPTWVAPTGGGTVTSVAASGGSTGLSFTGSPITNSGTLTLSGTLGTVNGGTNLTSYTTGDLPYASASNVLSKLTIGSNNTFLQVQSGIPSWTTNFTYDPSSNTFTAATGVTISGAGTRNDNFYFGLNHTDSITGTGRNRWNSQLGEQHFIVNDSSMSNKNIIDSAILGAFYNKLHSTSAGGSLSSSGIVVALNSMIEIDNNEIGNGISILSGVKNLVTPKQSNGSTGVIIGNFALGGSHNISDGSGSGVAGYWGQSSGTHSFVHGFVTTWTGNSFSLDSTFNPNLSPSHTGTVPRVLASGRHAINMSANSASQTAGFGTLADYSGMFCGYDHNIPSTSPQSVIIGGSGIVARASDPNQVYVPNFNIGTIPLNDDTLTQILVRNNSTGQIKYRNSSSIGALQTASQTLTAAQIKTLVSTPITLVAAQGANTVIEVISAYYVHTYGTVAFNFTGTVGLSIGTAGNLSISSGYATSTTLNATGNRTFTYIGNSIGPIFIVDATHDGRNTDLVLKVTSGSDATTGDSTGKIIVNYRVTSL